MNVLELFAGAGGGIYGGMLLGHTPVCSVEIVAKNRELLLQRQLDGIMPRFPIWDDVRTFDGHPWRGVVDIVSGGFPCTDISAAGKGAGIEGENSGLWREMARIVREVRPLYVFVENSPMLLTRGLGRVLGDLAACGYDCRWTCLSAADCGAPHNRDRIWILGTDTMQYGLERIEQGRAAQGSVDRSSNGSDTRRWPAESGVRVLADGLADRKHRIFALGNGQVPRVHAAAWRMLTQCEQ